MSSAYQIRKIPLQVFATHKTGGCHRTYLGETENVINEEKHILSFSITEMLGNSQTSQSNTSTSTRRLIHLTVDKSALALTLPQSTM